MNASLPPALAPYIHQCIEQRSLTLLTSVLDTPANWLVARLVVAALGGHDSRDTAASHLVGSKTAVVGHKIVLVSIWRSLDLCTELLRKSVGHIDKSRITFTMESNCRIGSQSIRCHKFRKGMLH